VQVNIENELAASESPRHRTTRGEPQSTGFGLSVCLLARGTRTTMCHPSTHISPATTFNAITEGTENTVSTRCRPPPFGTSAYRPECRRGARSLPRGCAEPASPPPPSESARPTQRCAFRTRRGPPPLHHPCLQARAPRQRGPPIQLAGCRVQQAQAR